MCPGGSLKFSPTEGIDFISLPDYITLLFYLFGLFSIFYLFQGLEVLATKSLTSGIKIPGNKISFQGLKSMATKSHFRD